MRSRAVALFVLLLATSLTPFVSSDVTITATDATWVWREPRSRWERNGYVDLYPHYRARSESSIQGTIGSKSTAPSSQPM